MFCRQDAAFAKTVPKRGMRENFPHFVYKTVQNGKISQNI